MIYFCLNPCSYGMLVESVSIEELEDGASLNPCSYGMLVE